MCSPGALAAGQAAVGIASAVAGHIGQKQAYKANREAAQYNFANRFNASETQRVQMDQERSEKAFDTAIAAVQAQGRIAASASEMGLSAGAAQQGFNSEMFGLGRQASVDDANDANQRVQLANERRGADIARISQINSVSKPSALGLVLGIGKAVVDAGTSYKQMGG